MTRRMPESDGTVEVQVGMETYSVSVNDGGHATVKSQISPRQYALLQHHYGEGFSEAEQVRSALADGIASRQAVTSEDVEEAAGSIIEVLERIERGLFE